MKGTSHWMLAALIVGCELPCESEAAYITYSEVQSFHPSWGVLTQIGRFPQQPLTQQLSDTGWPASYQQASLAYLHPVSIRGGASALAALEAESSPDAVVLGVWAAANMTVDGNLGAVGSAGISRQSFSVLPDPGEQLGDPVTLYAHFFLASRGLPLDSNAVNAARISNRLQQPIVDFAVDGTPWMMPLNLLIGEVFFVDLSVQRSVGPSSIYGTGPNSADVQLAITKSVTPPPPPIMMGPPAIPEVNAFHMVGMILVVAAAMKIFAIGRVLVSSGGRGK